MVSHPPQPSAQSTRTFQRPVMTTPTNEQISKACSVPQAYPRGGCVCLRGQVLGLSPHPLLMGGGVLFIDILGLDDLDFILSRVPTSEFPYNRKCQIHMRDDYYNRATSRGRMWARSGRCRGCTDAWSSNQMWRLRYRRC